MHFKRAFIPKIALFVSISKPRILTAAHYHQQINQCPAPQEWEMLVLARLHWNINPTTSVDHLPSLINSLHRLRPPLPPLPLLLPLVRPLLPICAQNYKLAKLPPSLQASVALLAALKPLLQMPPPFRG